MEEGNEIMKEAREVITTEQLLYRKRKDEIEKAHNEYAEIINTKDMPLEYKETLRAVRVPIVVKLLFETYDHFYCVCLA